MLVLLIPLLILILLVLYNCFRYRIASNILIFIAVLITCTIHVFSIISIYLDDESYIKYIIYLEGTLPSLWLCTTLAYKRTFTFKSLTNWNKTAILLGIIFTLFPLLISPEKYFISPDFTREHTLFITLIGLCYYSIIVYNLILSLINIEISFNAIQQIDIWKIKYEAITIIIILAAEIVYLSQAILFRTISMHWSYGFSAIISMASVTYIINMRRGNHEIRFTVSRQIAYKSLVVIFVGCYFILIGLFGEGLKYLGAPFSKIIVFSVATIGSTLILIGFMSKSFRRNVLIYLHKNFYEEKYDYRAQWNNFSLRLATAENINSLYAIVLTVYAEVFGFYCSALYLYDDEVNVYRNVAVHQMKLMSNEFKVNHYLIEYFQEKQWVYNRADQVNTPIEFENYLDVNLIKLIVPLFTMDKLDGFILLAHPIIENEKYIYEDFDLMKTIARQASISIANYRLAEEIIRMREIEAIGNISTFVIHDLKNHISALSLLLENSYEYIENPEFQKDMLISLSRTLEKMKQLIGKLKNLGEKELLNLKPLYLKSLVLTSLSYISRPNIEVIGDDVLTIGDPDELIKVIINILLNAVEASSDNKNVIVEIGNLPAPYFRVTDYGIGMSKEFITRQLFKPFVTTKVNGLGIGLYQCRRIIEAHGGSIEIQSQEGSGSIFTIYLPCMKEKISESIS